MLNGDLAFEGTIGVAAYGWTNFAFVASALFRASRGHPAVASNAARVAATATCARCCAWRC
ncbi:MAG: hypothetical protein ACLSIH_07900 [Eggerthella lenta]